MTVKQKIPLYLKIQIWNKFIGIKKGQTTCKYCKTLKISQFDFECGHIIPESKGGATTIENLRPICNKCNKSYGDKHMPDLYKWKLFLCC